MHRGDGQHMGLALLNCYTLRPYHPNYSKISNPFSVETCLETSRLETTTPLSQLFGSVRNNPGKP